MKDATRRRLSELIVEELAAKIRGDENLRKKLEPFTHLSVEIMADTILKHLNALLANDLKDMIPTLEAAAPVGSAQPAPADQPPPREERRVEAEVRHPIPQTPQEKPQPAAEVLQPHDDSIMRHFAHKDPFPTETFNIELSPDDWLYLYGFTYAPDSTGKGVPTRMLTQKGVDQLNNIFLVDVGDIRFYMNRLNIKDYSQDKSKRPVLSAHEGSRYKFAHETILNVLRSEEVMVSLSYWTILQGMEDVLKRIEERYVDMLRTMIEVHDAVDWDLEVFAFDHHILQLPSITAGAKSRSAPKRESKHSAGGRRDDVMIDKVIFREKAIAQEMHNQLILSAQRAKLDYMIRLETAFMDDWKSILSARYTVAKDKRKQFWQTVKSLQEEYLEYELMMKIRTPADHFTL